MRRPMTPEMLQYAQQDVKGLLHVFDELVLLLQEATEGVMHRLSIVPTSVSTASIVTAAVAGGTAALLPLVTYRLSFGVLHSQPIYEVVSAEAIAAATAAATAAASFARNDDASVDD